MKFDFFDRFNDMEDDKFLPYLFFGVMALGLLVMLAV